MIKEEFKDPFFVQAVKNGDEIAIDFNQTKQNEKLILECIICKKGFEVNSKKNSKNPSLNYCGDCYKKSNC